MLVRGSVDTLMENKKFWTNASEGNVRLHLYTILTSVRENGMKLRLITGINQ